MVNAKKAVRSKEMGLKKKVEVVGVSKLTLKNKLNSKETDKEKLINTQLGWKPVTPSIILNKNISVTVRILMKRKFFGLTTRSIKGTAFECVWSN
jgi:lambda repressor-like predicted transcriptional regulator